MLQVILRLTFDLNNDSSLLTLGSRGAVTGGRRIDPLSKLEEKIEFYFPSFNVEEYGWVRNPFINIPFNICLKLSEEEELASVFNNCGLQIKFTELTID
ncbi:Hypothetical predicted protein [Octopus vulgaris]|uniref:Uncharacterized protein n=1 Tax=Octopus vulgaris TaxID=6645 RepID=A0AA36F7G5_OCTVU|nr:Hypothetical predicted protein [Octopus vulgaris]